MMSDYYESFGVYYTSIHLFNQNNMLILYFKVMKLST